MGNDNGRGITKSHGQAREPVKKKQTQAGPFSFKSKRKETLQNFFHEATRQDYFLLQAREKALCLQAGGRNLLMQYPTAEGRKACRRGNFNLYEDRPAPDDPEQLELKRRYTQEREGGT